jgi:hypothetical protein
VGSAVDGMEAGNHHSKVSSSCEIILKLMPKCRYSRRVWGWVGTEGRRKPESEMSESVSLCATGRHPDHGHRGRTEGDVGRAASGQIFTVTERAGKLKSWKSEKLKSGPAKWARQDFRISGFHPSTCRTENLAG